MRFSLRFRFLLGHMGTSFGDLSNSVRSFIVQEIGIDGKNLHSRRVINQYVVIVYFFHADYVFRMFVTL